MYIIRYGGQNDKVIWKLSNYLRYFQKKKKNSKIWGGGARPPLVIKWLRHCPLQSYSVDIDSIQSTLVIYGPIWSYSVNFGFHLVFFSTWSYLVLFGPLLSYLVYFGPIKSFQSFLVHFCLI